MPRVELFWGAGSFGMRFPFALHRSMYSLSSSSAVSRISRELILRISRLMPLSKSSRFLPRLALRLDISGLARSCMILRARSKNPSTSNLGVAKSSEEPMADLDLEDESDVRLVVESLWDSGFGVVSKSFPDLGTIGRSGLIVRCLVPPGVSLGMTLVISTAGFFAAAWILVKCL